MEFLNNPRREDESEMDYYERLLREKAETGTEMDKLAYDMIQRIKVMNQNPINAVDPQAFYDLGRMAELYREGELLDDTVPQLIEKLSASNAEVRMKAAQQLLARGDSSAVEPLVRALSDPLPEVRGAALGALTKIDPARAIKPLMDALTKLNPVERTSIEHLIREVGTPTVPMLISVLGHADSEVRWQTAQLLGGLRDPRALPALQEVVRKDKGVTEWGATVKKAASAAIRTIEAAEQRKMQPALIEHETQGSDGEFDWEGLMRNWSKAILESNDVLQDVPDEAIDAQWLGYPPATEAQIVAVEAQLGMTFPPSYRAFLKVSNGWHKLTHSIYDLRPLEKVALFATENPEWATAWDFVEELTDEEYLRYGDEQHSWRWRPQYMKTALQISDVGDSAVFLLNPNIVSHDGEWEAWFMATWNPEGPARFRSFSEMMQAKYQSFLAVEDLNSD